MRNLDILLNYGDYNHINIYFNGVIKTKHYIILSPLK